jgi:TolB-like protein
MAGKILEINLFGACSIRSARPEGFVITGAKHRALFALLATAPFGRRTRAFLQETLWGTTCYDTGRQSLRRALADIKQIMGESYGALLCGNNLDLTIDLSRVRFVGHTQAGPFLEGLDIRERGFQNWLEGIRQNPSQLAGLFSLTDRPSFSPVLPAIAVLPFRAIGGDPSDTVLGDWLAEEICRSLSRSRLLAVISHLSCRELSLGPVDIAGVRSSLRSDFCVFGSLRRMGSHIVLDADLVDTRSGRIIWTRQFEDRAEHFLERSAEGLTAIIASIGSAIADEALAHARSHPLAEIEDHRLLIAGVSLMHRATLREFARSRELLEEALRRAPDTPEVHGWLGKWYVLSVFNGWSTDVARETGHALDCTARGLDLSPDNAFCLTIDGFAHNNLLRRMDVAEVRYNAALQSNPNSALSWLLKGVLHAFRDEGNAATDATYRARRLSPLDPFGYFYDSLDATACLSTGDYERALELADRSLSANNRHLSTLRAKIIALHNLDRRVEAIEAAQELLRRQPDFTVANYLGSHPAADNRVGRIAAAALSAAGIP